jgi:hypothetical protein
LTLWIRQPGSLERDYRIRVLAQINKYLAVGKPRPMVMGEFLEHSPNLFASLLCPAGAAVGPREVHSSIREVWVGDQYRLERENAAIELVLIEQRRPEQPPAMRVSRKLSFERA